MDLIQTFFEASGLSCLFLLDVRQTARSMGYLKYKVEHHIPGLQVLTFPPAPPKSVKPGQRQPTIMGGTVALIHSRWRHALVRSQTDGSGLSVTVKLTFKIDSSTPATSPHQFAVIGAYIPPTTFPKGPYTLHARLKSYLASTTRPGATPLSPRAYVQTVVKKWALRAQAKARLVLVVGDLNGSLELNAKNPIREWVHSMALRAPLTDTLGLHKTYFTFYRGPQGMSRIDHALHSSLPSYASLSEHGVHNCPRYTHVLEHRPVWIGLHFSNIIPPPHSIPYDRSPRLDLRSMPTTHASPPEPLPPELSNYRSHIKQWTTDNAFDAEEASSARVSNFVAALSIHSVQTTAECQQKSFSSYMRRRMQQKRSPIKDGYSPEMRLIQDSLHLHTHLRQIAHGPSRWRRKVPWTQATYYAILLPLVNSWRSRRLKLFPTSDDHTNILNLRNASIPSLPGPAIHIDPVSLLDNIPYPSMTRTFFDRRIHLLRHRLHGRFRSDLRSRMSTRVALMQEALEIKNFKAVYQKIGFKLHQTIDLSYLVRDNAILTNPMAIHDAHVDHFQAHHSCPLTLDPCACSLTEEPDFWRTLFSSDSPPTSPPGSTTHPTHSPSPPIHPDSNIPPRYQDLIRKMCRRKVSQDVADELARVLREEITLEQFKAAIRAMPAGKAPGPSGLTANMIKAWPEETIVVVHAMLSKMWKDKSIPPWWGDKLLCGIPKKPGESSLSNVRPIGLLEILRKLWTSIIVTRIQLVWEKHGILHPSQSGYRWRRGTSTAIIQVVNAMEDARHSPEHTPLYCTFWDYKAAFDSIPRNLMRLAWARLGIPEEHLQWLTSMDEEGLTFFLSPYMSNRLDTASTEDLLDPDAPPSHLLKQLDSAFSCERGVTQGDTMSTICWVAIFDMILSLVDPLAQADDPAYADDLATLSLSAEDQQEKADRISAFCLFSGMAIAFPKVEAICIKHPLHKHRPPPSLILRDWQWRAIPVPIIIPKPAHHSRYLGSKVAFGPLDKISHRWCVAHLQGSLEVLQTRRATQDCRRKVIEGQLFIQTLYHGSHAAWNLKAYQRLDSILAGAIRRLHRLPRSYPTDLIFLPKSDHGLGYRRISDAAQLQKWGILQRSIALGGRQATTSLQLIRRALDSPTETLYATSLIEWGLLHNIRLTDIAPGPPPPMRPPTDDLRHQLALTDPDDFDDMPIGAIFTDGSYTATGLTPLTLLTHPSKAYQQGTGGIGIVWLPPEEELRMSPARILRIIPTPESSHLPHMTANTMELYAQVAAARLSTTVPPEVPMFSDCKSVVQSITEATSFTRRPMGHTAKGIFYESVAAMDNARQRMVKWTRSHPERRHKDRSTWTYQDIGIFLADAVAEGDWSALDDILGVNGYLPTITSSCDDILCDILRQGIWHWRHSDEENNPPVLDDLMSHVNHSYLRKYTSKRDDYRAQVDDPPRWHDINPALAYAVCPKKPRTTAQIINATNRVYRKSHRYGNNRGKGLIGPAKDEAEKCPHCDAPETPSHIYAECRAPGLHALRVRLKDSQRRALATMTHNSIPQWQYRFFENLHLLSFETDDDYAEKFWNATLGRSDMMLCFEHATDATRDLTASQFQAFKKLFIEFVTPLTEGAIEVERLKFQLKYGKILPSLASALRSRVDKGSLPPTATLDPRHPIVQALAITITAGNRKRRIPADPDSPPKFLATVQTSIAPPTSQNSTLSLSTKAAALHSSRYGRDTYALPTHYTPPASPPSLDDTAPVIDPEPPPD